MLLPEFTEATYRQIPILKAMGMEVADYTGSQLSLSFPLANNVNDKGTGFAGSINAAATYCAWAILHLLLKEEGLSFNLAVVTSQTEFRRPVTTDYIAQTSLPEEQVVQEFLEKLKTKGKASLEMESRIMQGDKVALSYVGTYVAFPKV